MATVLETVIITSWVIIMETTTRLLVVSMIYKHLMHTRVVFGLNRNKEN